MRSTAPFFVGYVSLKSNLSLEHVGEILSNKVFGGIAFSGKELEIHEEIPALFIHNTILGFRIVLDGYSGFDQSQYFTLSVRTCVSIEGVNPEIVRLDSYLFNLLKVVLKEIPEIEVFED
ncbi:MAG: hypothetical protein ABIQ88_16590 [Chitinophagaceae bacterium]